jgi:hypothetical protein
MGGRKEKRRMGLSREREERCVKKGRKVVPSRRLGRTR